MDDVFLLSRIQFALTIMFHYIFPPLSIGLGAIMVIMEGMYLRTGNVIYHQMTRFWSRVFAVNFAMGVATGIVMEFQFGTNWAAFSRYVGDVFGSALAAKGIFGRFRNGALRVNGMDWRFLSEEQFVFDAGSTNHSDVLGSSTTCPLFLERRPLPRIESPPCTCVAPIARLRSKSPTSPPAVE